MAFNYRDLWLGIGFVALGYCAALAIHKQLLAVRKMSELPDRQAETTDPKECSADDIKLDTLAILASNVNRNIGFAAKQIIAERASQGLPYELLLRDLIGDDTAKRDRSLVSLRYLHDTVSKNVLKPYYGTFVAVVDCLCSENMTCEALSYEELRESSEIYRSQPFNNTLQLLNQIILDANEGNRDSRCGLSVALRAGVISRWLAKYPWGGQNADGETRRRIFNSRMKDPKGDDHMSNLLRNLVWDMSMGPDEDDTGLQQLYKHGLVDTEYVRGAELLRQKYKSGPSVVMLDIDMTERSQGPGTNVIRNPQSLEESFEERMLQQRRREAVVIGEEIRPVD